jgi:hypothetical protein
LIPDVTMLDPWAPAVMDQGQTGSCTGHSPASALYTAFNVIGQPLPWVPSPAGIYRVGRAIDRPNTSTPLTDDGAEPNQVFRSINEFGVHPIQAPTSDGRYSDADPATINDEPSLGELEADAVTCIVGDYGITSTGTQRVDDVCSAIANKHPVTVAIAGGSNTFQAYSGGVLGPIEETLDHYVWLYGYETVANGSRVFHGRNSWGRDWGISGDFMLSEDALQWLGDLVALDVRRK